MHLQKSLPSAAYPTISFRIKQSRQRSRTQYLFQTLNKIATFGSITNTVSGWTMVKIYTETAPFVWASSRALIVFGYFCTFHIKGTSLVANNLGFSSCTAVHKAGYLHVGVCLSNREL